MNSSLHQGVVAEPPDALSSQKEAYWLPQGKHWLRIVTNNSNTVGDGEVSWTAATVAQYRKESWRLIKRLVGKQESDTMQHPSGAEMERDGSSRDGFLFTLVDKASDLDVEISSRMIGQSATLTHLSDSKIFAEGGIPICVHEADEAFAGLSDSILPVEQVEEIYRHSFGTITELMTKFGDHMDPDDLKLLFELQQFRRDRVRLAGLTHDEQLFAKESGMIGNAWIAVVPSGHQRLQSQRTMFSVAVDNAKLNTYLSILPYAISERWAAMGSIHELSHLKDLVTGVEPKVGKTRQQYLDGEHRAYSIERALADGYSQGRLRPVLRAILAQALQAPNPMTALNDLISRRLPAISKSIDQCLNAGPAQSGHEVGIRQSLYQMLLGFEMAHHMHPTDQAMRHAMEKSFIEVVYEPTGHLPKE